MRILAQVKVNTMKKKTNQNNNNKNHILQTDIKKSMDQNKKTGNLISVE